MVIAALIVGCEYYYTYANIYDDQLLVDTIRANPKVIFSNIELHGLSDKGTWGLFFRNVSSLGNAVRPFAAYEYPPGSVPPSQNRKIVGLIDERLNVLVYPQILRGDFVFQ